MLGYEHMQIETRGYPKIKKKKKKIVELSFMMRVLLLMDINATLLLFCIYNYVIKSSLLPVFRMFGLITRTEKSVLISASLKFGSELETVCDYACFCMQSWNYSDDNLNVSDIFSTKQFQ